MKTVLIVIYLLAGSESQMTLFEDYTLTMHTDETGPSMYVLMKEKGDTTVILDAQMKLKEIEVIPNALLRDVTFKDTSKFKLISDSVKVGQWSSQQYQYSKNQKGFFGTFTPVVVDQYYAVVPELDKYDHNVLGLPILDGDIIKRCIKLEMTEDNESKFYQSLYELKEVYESELDLATIDKLKNIYREATNQETPNIKN